MFSRGMISVSCPSLTGETATVFTSPETQVPMCFVGRQYLRSFPRFRYVFSLGVLVLVTLLLGSAPLYAEEQDRISSMRSTLTALNSARQTALDELKDLYLSAAESTDYRDFIVYLNTRIFNDCRELAKLGGEAALEGMQCPAGEGPVGTSGGQVQPTDNIFYTTGSASTEALTQGEKTAELEDDFLNSLGEFDEMLLKEDDKIANRVPSQREPTASGQAGSSGSDGALAGGFENTSGGTGEGDERSGEGSSSDGQGAQAGEVSTTQSGSGAEAVDHSAYGAPGGKLPPPEDDDIVARQLREAAEKEPDPELKKKLWEEYWKYKGVNKQDE